MIKQRGMTLIEIIVSIALLGIIALGFLPALTGNFKLLSNTKKLTHDAFKAQQDMELSIQDVKDKIKAGNIPAGQETYTLFNDTDQRSVTGYLREVNIGTSSGSRKIYTIIADTRLPEYKVAVASNVKISLYSGSNIIPNAYTDTPNLNIKLNNLTLTDPDNVNLTNLYHWYISREGFNIPVIADPQETEMGSKYPKFPDDYMIIPSQTSDCLNSIPENYVGKFIVCTVTPASASGKMGAAVPSNPVFISGLPVTSNLRLHLDASMISKDDINLVRLDSSSGNYYVKKWNDISGNNCNAEQIDTSKQPQLIENRFGFFVGASGKVYDTYSKFLKFNGSQLMSVINSSAFNLNSNMTVFVVARTADMTANKSIVSKFASNVSDSNTWRLGWNADNTLGLFINNNNRTNMASANPGEGIDSKWHIIKTFSESGNLYFQIDKGTVFSSARTAGSITNNQRLTIGGDSGRYGNSNVDIAEIIIYSSISDSDKDKVSEYLNKKYQSTADSVNINYIDSIYDKVLKNQPYTMPYNVTAHLNTGEIFDLPAVWNSSIDTSTAGLKTATGSATLNNTVSVTLTVNVLTISSIDYIPPATVQEGDSFIMPSTVMATLSDGSKKSVDVVWSPSLIDTSTAGTKTCTGTAVYDTNQHITLTVNVVPRHIKLNKTSTGILVGKSEQLIATVIPADAPNKNVTWSSDNTSVASVDSNGIVTGVAKGTANITAKTVDGGYTATCNVNVRTKIQFVSYSVSNINKWTTSYWIFWTEYHMSADVTLLFDDGTTAVENVEDSSLDDYPTIKVPLSGSVKAITPPYETVSYNVDIVVNP